MPLGVPCRIHKHRVQMQHSSSTLYAWYRNGDAIGPTCEKSAALLTLKFPAQVSNKKSGLMPFSRFCL